MSQTTSFRPSPVPSLPGLPKASLTAQQQLEALQRVQTQAEQRVLLGVQLFKAAEARTSQYRQALDEVKVEQEKLRSEVQEDVTRSLHTYDQWIGQMEDDFTSKIQSLEAKMAKLQSDWTKTQQRIEGMMKRSEAMLDQSRVLLEATPASADSAPASAATSLAALEEEDQSAEEIVPFEALAPLADELPAPAVEIPLPPPADVMTETPDFFREALAKLREHDQENSAA